MDASRYGLVADGTTAVSYTHLMRVLILKPQVDTKGGGELVSRLGVRRKADLLIPPETDVYKRQT